MPTQEPVVPTPKHYSRWDGESHITITISPPLQTVDYRQSTDQQTAQATTTALETALLKSLKG